MKIDNYQLPKSSFLSTEKDMGLIVNKMIKNERLKRLLHYTSRDALDKPDISMDETIALFGKNIKTVPKFKVDKDIFNYIVIRFKNFTQSSNPEFRDNIIEFDIVCHYDQWQLKDFALRPYKIAAEIDSMFNGKYLTGIGKLDFLIADQLNINDEFGGLCIMYQAVHGEEDKKFMPNPADEERFIEDFKALMG